MYSYPSLFLIIYIFIFGFSIFDTLKRDILFSFYLISLFTYSFFSIYTYLNYPEVITLFVNLPIDTESLSRAILFTSMSTISLYFSFYFFYIPFNNKKLEIVYLKRNQKIFFYLIFLFIAILFVFTFPIRNFLNYNIVQLLGTEVSSTIFKIFITLFKYLPYLIITLYIGLRQKLFVNKNKNLSKYLIVFLVFTFLILSFLLGNRTDILRLTLSIFYFEVFAKDNIRKINIFRNFYNFISTYKLNKKDFNKFFVYSIIITIGVILIYSLLFIRGEGDNFLNRFVNFNSPIDRFIYLNDFTFPFTLLATIINNNVIMPSEVIYSNLANSLAGIDYKYLQEITLNYINYNRLVNDAISPGFFSFSEGYMAMGLYGFIYNGIVFGFLISIYKKICNTKDNQANQFLTSLIIGTIPALVRAQSATMVKQIWFYIIPTIILYQLLSGINIKIRHYYKF